MTRTLNGVDVQKLVAEETMVGCAACNRLIVRGEAFTQVRLGPGRDPKERERARKGDAYDPVRVTVHWACATGEED